MVRMIRDPWVWLGIFLGIFFVVMVLASAPAHANTSGVSIVGQSHECMRFQKQNMTLYHMTAFNTSDTRKVANYSWTDADATGTESIRLGANAGSYLNIWVKPGHSIENIKVTVNGETVFYRTAPFKYKARCA